MKNINKIIPFKQKTRGKSEFRLKTEISIYICRKDEKYTLDCTYSDKSIHIKEIIRILKKILKKLSDEVPTIEYNNKDSYNISFTILYYEDINNKNKFKYIFLPKNIELKKIAEYLFIFTSIYEYRNSDDN